jgi:transitional endoplasmic reticulum ATPase
MTKRRYRAALDRVDRRIEDTMPLFQDCPWVLAERRLAWLYRIDILREAGCVTEALAWACLEVDLNPDNVTAAALKTRLKREAGLMSEDPESPLHTPVKRTARTSWNGVAGMRDLKAMLERDVILPFQEPEVYETYKVDLPNGILLYGPPGCGKTHIARKLAEVVDASFYEIKPGDLASTYVHGTQGMVADTFKKARENAPSILFFDEIDAMVPNRGGASLSHHYASEVNEFLVQMNDCGKDGVLIVGATNLPERIDKAVLRPGRLDKQLFVGPPDYEARVELLKMYMADRPQQAIDWHNCAIELENYTCAEIEFLVDEAARRALDESRLICTGDVLNAAGNNPSAITEAALLQICNSLD